MLKYMELLKDITDSRAGVSISPDKQAYNLLLVRFKRGESYMNNNDIPLTQRERQIPQFKKIMDELSALLNEIKTYTSKEALEGFPLIDDRKIS